MRETARLVLRPARLADVAELYRFLGDAEAMRFTHLHRSLKECRRRVAVHEFRRRVDGCAPWSVFLRESGRIIGWGGLFNDPFDPGWGVELGYWFHPDVWGQGYGSELAAAAVREADQVLTLPRIAAFARRDNAGSRRILEKVGFRPVRYLPEIERDLFERPRPSP